MGNSNLTNSPNVILFADITGVEWFSRGYGAYRLASEIRKHGYTAVTVDFSTFLTWETFTQLIDKTVGPDTLVVGFSSTWFPFRHQVDGYPNPRYTIGEHSKSLDASGDLSEYNGMAYKISQGQLEKYVEYIKQANPKVKVILGGAKAYEYMQEPCLDNVFIGYSENQLVDYLNSISKKSPRRLFSKIINYDPKAQIGKFDFNNSITTYVDTDCIHPEELGTIEFSRGCIFNCSFCSYPHRNQDTRNYVKYQEVIRKELLDNYHRWGLYKYVITDDTFNDYTEKLILINEVIQTLPFNPKFWAYIRQDIVARNPEQAQLIKDIGIKEIYYGLDTWHDGTAKRIKKGGSLAKKIEGMRICKECWGDEVFVMAGIVVGLPLDTVKSIDDSIQWYQTEGYKYVDTLIYTSLTLKDFGDANQYQLASDIEKDLKGYNYTFPNVEKDPFGWVRHDSGDIITKEQADVIMANSLAAVQPYWNKQLPWESRLPGLTEMFVDSKTTDKKEMIHNYAITEYFPKLLSILQNKTW